ncbi:siderophore iron transporter [Sporothrix schenckii 1099-18]|uniref:Siderophore iron transporter n=1 Tax=Sporothrix schenckii 1099-18 TaxID=1397361 RepID=A0A0F2MCR9_SPOSC|nr:siderophore iron transporter [Sporothrix schenckii 1099-18]KJR86889.1 siderophore iron transporter [Sporothrix schenckii 1099-18]
MAISPADQYEVSPATKEEADIDVHEQRYENIDAAPLALEASDGKLTKEIILAYFALCCQINAYIMTLLVPGAMLTAINADLGPDNNYTWITLCWPLGASVFVSIGGRLTDIFGRRYFMITGALISIAGTLVGANGKSIPMMIVSGALFGVGSGFQELCYACAQEIVPNRYRVMAVGGLDVSLALAFSSPVVAYAIAGYHPSVGWRGAYWYLFAFHTFAFVMLVLFYRPPDYKTKHREDGKTRWQLLMELDYVGLLLFLAGGVLFLLGINFGGRTYAWNSAGCIAPIVVGFCCFVAVGFWCAYADLKYPLFPPKLFKQVREFDMVIVVCFVGGMLYYSMNVLWPRQSQAFFIGADTPVVMKGVWAIIFSCGTWVAGLLTVFVCSRLHHEKWQLVAFTVVQTALIGSMASVGSADETQAIVTVVITAATITPPQLLSFTMLSFGLADQRDLGVAVGLAGTFRLFGGAVATAIYTAIYSNRQLQTLPGFMTEAIQQSGVPFSDALLSSLVKAAATNTLAAYEKVAGVTPELAALAVNATKQSYVKGFSLVYLVAIAFGVLATGAALCTVSTDRAKKNNERAVVMMNEVDKYPTSKAV